MTKQELKPCPNPWCRFEGTATVESMTQGPARVICRCGVRTPDVGWGQGEKESEKLAIAAWNARPADPTGELVEALTLCEHKISQHMQGQYPAGQALMAALETARAALAKAGSAANKQN